VELSSGLGEQSRRRKKKVGAIGAIEAGSPVGNDPYESLPILPLKNMRRKQREGREKEKRECKPPSCTRCWARWNDQNEGMRSIKGRGRTKQSATNHVPGSMQLKGQVLVVGNGGGGEGST